MGSARGGHLERSAYVRFVRISAVTCRVFRISAVESLGIIPNLWKNAIVRRKVETASELGGEAALDLILDDALDAALASLRIGGPGYRASGVEFERMAELRAERVAALATKEVIEMLVGETVEVVSRAWSRRWSSEALVATLRQFECSVPAVESG